jgi:hypothetical protein
MTIKTLYPNVRPTLDLAFAATKALDPRITFTRASTGTYVGSNGTLRTAGINEARFDHSPLTLESLGLLLEEARTNLLLQSEDFSTSWTTVTAAVTTNVATAPNGTTTADLYSGTSTSAVNQSVSLTSGVTYTISFYVKSAGLGNDSFRLRIDGAQTSSNFTATSEWQRFTFTATSANTGARTCGIVRNTPADNVDVLIWGAQLEVGAFPTSYIPTTSATVTRAADVASITGTNFSSWYNQREGTVFAEYSNQATAGQDRRIFNTSDATGFTTNGSSLFLSNVAQAAASLNTFVGGVNIGVMHSSTPLVVGVVRKTAYSIQVNSRVLVVGGAAPLISSSSYTPPSNIVSANLMQNNGSSSANGHIRRLTYWPWRLSNATLQALTS